MKNTIYRFGLMISLMFIGLSSCEIARDLDDYDPLFALDAD